MVELNAVHCLVARENIYLHLLEIESTKPRLQVDVCAMTVVISLTFNRQVSDLMNQLYEEDMNQDNIHILYVESKIYYQSDVFLFN